MSANHSLLTERAGGLQRFVKVKLYVVVRTVSSVPIFTFPVVFQQESKVARLL